MHEVTLTIFDPNITASSPAGSCLLKMLRAASSRHKLELFTAQTDLQSNDRIIIHKMPVPMRPVFLQSVFFTVCSVFWRRLIPVRNLSLSIVTQGGFPFCDISYAHCCHKLFLTRYRENITGGLVTRSARLLNHYWSAHMEAAAFQIARLIVVPSEGLANELTAAYGSAIAPKLRIIANPVDCQMFSPPKSETTRRDFTFAFCALGNFDWKGLPLILDALATGIPAQLQVIGGGSAEIDRFRNIARSLNLTSQVTFVGTQKDIRPYLWAADAFVFPSVYETFPLVCLQAAAAGLPLIATNLYGLEQLLEPGVSGWRVERTVESVRQAMSAAFGNPQHASRMGRNAQALAQKYDEPAFQKRWLELLDEVVRSVT